MLTKTVWNQIDEAVMCKKMKDFTTLEKRNILTCAEELIMPWDNFKSCDWFFSKGKLQI